MRGRCLCLLLLWLLPHSPSAHAAPTATTCVPAANGAGPADDDPLSPFPPAARGDPGRARAALAAHLLSVRRQRHGGHGIQLVLGGECSALRLQRHPLLTTGAGLGGRRRGTWFRLGEAELRPWSAEDLSRLLMRPHAAGTPPLYLRTVVVEAEYWRALQAAGLAGAVAATLAPFLGAAAGPGSGHGRRLVVAGRRRHPGSGAPPAATVQYWARELLVPLPGASSPFAVASLRWTTLRNGGRAPLSSDVLALSVAFDRPISPGTRPAPALRPLCGPNDPGGPCAARTVVVNLDRRPDRWQRTRKALAGAGFAEHGRTALPNGTCGQDGVCDGSHGFERWSAVDGPAAAAAAADGQWSADVRHLFRTHALVDPETGSMRTNSGVCNPYRDHGFRRGVLGCALSHLLIWRDLAARDDLGPDDFYLVLEDDVEPRRQTLLRWRVALLTGLAEDSAWDWVYWSFLDSGNGALHRRHDARVMPGVRAFDQAAGPRTYGGGTGAYVMRKRGAARLLRAARATGIAQPVDWFMIETGFGGRAADANGDGQGGQGGGRGRGLVYLMDPQLVATPGGMRGFEDAALSDTTEYYPPAASATHGQLSALWRAAVTACGGATGTATTINATAVSSSLPEHDVVVAARLPMVVVPAGALAVPDPRVTFPAFDVNTELQLLPAAGNRPGGGARILDGHTCSRVCVSVAAVADRRRIMHDEDGSNGGGSRGGGGGGGAAAAAPDYHHCREMDRAGLTWRVPLRATGHYVLAMWMENAAGQHITEATTRVTVAAVDVARVEATFHRPPGQASTLLVLNVVDLAEGFYAPLYRVCWRLGQGAPPQCHPLETGEDGAVLPLRIETGDRSDRRGLAAWLEGPDGTRFGGEAP